MNRQNRKEMARQTLDILDQGCYRTGNTAVDIARQVADSIQNSILITPDQGAEIIQAQLPAPAGPRGTVTLRNHSTIEAIQELLARGQIHLGVLNFASAKNPGGGFLGGSLAQEESLAVSSCLYSCQLEHPRYYEANRDCGTMAYTDHAIYSPDVVFFRDNGGNLLEQPLTASVLTLPAVNYGQAVLKKENLSAAKETMRRRMGLALAVFARMGCQSLVLGAFGCGVFRNNPVDVAGWWADLLEEGWAGRFQHLHFAVLDSSKERDNYRAFEECLGVYLQEGAI